MAESNCIGLHPYGPCGVDQGCNAPKERTYLSPAGVRELKAQIDSLRPRMAELEAENERLRHHADKRWLHDPRRAAALEAVAEAARAALDVNPTSRAGAEVHIRLEAALDAVPAAETGSKEPSCGEPGCRFHASR